MNGADEQAEEDELDVHGSGGQVAVSFALRSWQRNRGMGIFEQRTEIQCPYIRESVAATTEETPRISRIERITTWKALHESMFPTIKFAAIFGG
jgi:hypothetical protein